MAATVLAVTPGESAGVGPECLVRLAAMRPDLPLLAVADASMLAATAARLDIDLEVVRWQSGDGLKRATLSCRHVALAAPSTPARLNPANSPYVLDCLRTAVDLIGTGDAHALVTGPVHKGIINEAGIGFTGHTEFLAALAGGTRVVMMLAAGQLRVALVTTHLPLREVPDAVTGAAVEETIVITEAALREWFAIPSPRIQVLGLNPHSGEGGHLGREDGDVIAPAIERCREQGMDLMGPVPADTAFTPGALARCDAVIAMYHDQGLPVLKHAGFGKAVNITLGLPFIRTSVDHGTALDIAGQGLADPASLERAAEFAARLAVA